MRTEAHKWIDDARRPVAEVAREAMPDVPVGGRRTLACPVCKRQKRSRDDRKRGPVNIVSEYGWRCQRDDCGAHGDWLDYLCFFLHSARWKDLQPEQKSDVRDWMAARGWCDPYQGSTNRPVRPRPRQSPRVEEPPPPPLHPPLQELDALWSASHRLGGVRDPKVREFIERRQYTLDLWFLERTDVARVLPADEDVYPVWWPAGRRTTWRVAVRAFTSSGQVGSIHARAVGELPVFSKGTPEESVAPKTLWPKHPDEAERYDVSDLCFACESGQAVLLGKPSPYLRRVFFVEGVTDFIRMTGAAGARQILPTDAHVGSGVNAVFGGTSGQFRGMGSLGFRPATPEAPLTFYAATDADPSGRRYLLELAEGLHPRPLMRLPLERWSEAAATERPDLSDVLDAGVELAAMLAEAELVSLEDLRAQVAADRAAKVSAPASTPAPTDEEPESDLVVNISDKQMSHLLDEAWWALLKTNDPPRVFLRAGTVVGLRFSDDRASIAPMDHTTMQGHLARSCRWTRWRKATDGELKAEMDDERRPGCIESNCEQPPKFLAPDMVALPSPELPPLQAVVSSPVYDRDGVLIQRPGYSRRAALWYEPPPRFHLPNVMTAPQDRAVEQARRLIVERWLGDFPFVKDSDRAHAVAALILPFVRRMIDSPTPLHLVEAASPGTGKSLLAKCILIVSNVGVPDSLSFPSEDDEMRKLITSHLSEGASIMFFDDVQAKLASASLARALTSVQWRDRVLGMTGTVQAENSALWMATTNNAVVNTDIARRSVRVRLDRGMERPWEWSGARIEHLETWTTQHRSELVGAVLTLVQAWLSRGRPTYKHNLGSFESWSTVIGGILTTAGIPGFLADMAELYETADSDMAEWYIFLAEWYSKKGEAEQTPAALASFAREGNLLGDILGDKSERSQATRLGKALGRLRDRVMEGLKIRTSRARAGVVYFLEKVGETADERRARLHGAPPPSPPQPMLRPAPPAAPPAPPPTERWETSEPEYADPAPPRYSDGYTSDPDQEDW